jgi:hypothetical protein
MSPPPALQQRRFGGGIRSYTFAHSNLLPSSWLSGQSRPKIECAVDVNQKTIPDRRRWARHKVHTPAFASFDGVTGGMILDLSEQGMSMQTATPIEAHHPIQLHLNLSEPTVNVETTGYIAWADALGRAGVRFSDCLRSRASGCSSGWLSMTPRRAGRLPSSALANPRRPHQERTWEETRYGNL